eukprot:CAMPEP_0172538052 /NCGR_PEP_ID=MMETSP1067-20121228/9533_1 /TAXON_ID=265564 ORGANISM="Thalassiosira punctigera, Strain Tpunct2005C2" /NCGR_SAMPLE_ID=MMETSP1067 /ASSEMBLY_ACC=CAM_ASM_000444 /LENGTH=290 /DNA_ID=CAMNT_0013323473 /DNA_START=124 /DNA_END=996 /DNA_ORIENTATION=+
MTTSPQSITHLYRPNSTATGDSEREASSSAMVTPCSHSGMSMMEKWMAARNRQRETDNLIGDSHGHGQISPIARVEVSRAVYGILRDNLPPAMEAQTSQEELALIADSIESKLCQTASSPRAYCSAFSKLEFRITALATAVLIHSDKSHANHEHRPNGGYQVVSDTCARLSAAARKSLVYCVMVLVSYEKRNLNDSIQQRRRKLARMEKNWGRSQGRDRGGSAAAMEGMYARRAAEDHLRQLEKYSDSDVLADFCQFEKMKSLSGMDPSIADDLGDRADLHSAGDSNRIR